ncbi:MAG TPA: carbohydrate ABC transporter permease [Ruminiclostridium sp.]
MLTKYNKKVNIPNIIIYIILLLIVFTSLFPVINTIAISFSNSSKASAGVVTIYPIGFNLDSYKKILQETMFFNAFWISVKRVVLVTAMSFIITVLAAYPLSKEKKEFRSRDIYMWILVFTMMFGPGLIPSFLNIKDLHLLGSLWALVLPNLVGQFLIILVVNFFRSLPKELDDSSSIDGAGPWQKLFKIYLPLAIPILATITLFIIVGQWNAFFDGLIYMNKTSQYPLQTYIQQMVITIDPLKFLAQGGDISKIGATVSNRTLNAAKLVVTMVPVLVIYPYLQKYFVKGIMLGSVKE